MDISPAVRGVKTDEQARELLIQAGIEGLQARAGYVPGVDNRPLPIRLRQTLIRYINKRRKLIDDFAGNEYGIPYRKYYITSFLPSPTTIQRKMKD